ncbi:MAG: NHL repeat-containing protein [Pseudomonadota bacterium]
MQVNVMVSIHRCLAWLVTGALCLSLAACFPPIEEEVVDTAVQPSLPPGLSLIAGNIGGIGSVNAAIAIDARFYSPIAIAADGLGNLFVAERDNHTIRKIVIATGVVTTLAGTAGFSGSADGTGAAARFDEIYGITADVSGNVYVADSTNHTIRQITPAGVVTTLAGTAGSAGSTNGTGAAARFNFPVGLIPDGAGNLFVADTNNHTIRQIVIATGVVTTLAGTAGSGGSTNGTGAAARFQWPRGIVSDGAGNLYVADTSNYTIRQIVIATGVVTTPVGTAGSWGDADGIGAAAQFEYPAGITIDGLGNLFVTDVIAHTIRQVVIATGVVTTLAGTAHSTGSADGTGAAARFEYPYSIAADPSGNVYITDTDNHTIRQIVPATAVVTTFAGAIESAGSADGIGAAARFEEPTGITTDASGNMYVADGSNHTIRKITPDGIVTTLAGTAGSNGNADGVGAAAQFYNPFGITIDASGNLYIGDADNHLIRQVTPAGVVTTVASGFTFPFGVAVDGAGNLYVADNGNSVIRKVVIATGVVTTFAGTVGVTGSTDGTGAAARFEFPVGITADGLGNLYVTDTNNHTIRKIVIATGEVTTLAGTPGSRGSVDGTGAAALFDFPLGITADGAGNLFVADTSNNTIRKIVAATGVVTTVAGVAGQQGVGLGDLPGGLTEPYGVAFIGVNTLAVTTSNGVVRIVLP